MIKLEISCESADEARVYLNAAQYHNLISDMCQAFRNAQKHGTDADVLQVVANFYPDLCTATENSTGAY